jgi:peptide/nickel transport system ATP-binding protein
MLAPGEAPSLIEPPGGCRFHPRCPRALAVCAEERPPSFNIGEGHWAACWLFGDGAPAQRVSISERPAFSNQDISQE